MTADLDLRERVPLAPFTTLGLGGPARFLAACPTEEAVRAGLAFATERKLPVMILGGGSNVVFPDAGFPGVVLRITSSSLEFEDGAVPEVTADAGVSWDAVVASTVERGWAGLECLSGIPGTVGGTPIQNVGAYGAEVASTIRSVTCLDRTTLARRTFDGNECGFAYRDSRFKREDRDRYVVLSVRFALERHGPPRLEYPELRTAVGQAGALDRLDPAEALRRVRDTVLALRRGKSMVLDPADPNTRSVGSFFVNPVLMPPGFAELERRWAAAGGSGAVPTFPAEGGVKVPAAWLVERAGFARGHRLGGAGISSRHALALVNHEGSSADLLELADRIIAGVEERFGVRLTPEPVIVRTPLLPQTRPSP